VIPSGATGAVAVSHLVGLEVETTLIPTAGGFVTTWSPAAGAAGVGEEFFIRSLDGTTLTQIILFRNLGAADTIVRLRATVWNDNYLSPAAAKRMVKVTFYKNARKAIEKLRP
jgi:hypothetical protein